MVANQYPYFLWIQQVADATQNENGQYQRSAVDWVLHGPCRDEVNNQGRSVTLEDGSAQVYNALIQLPKSTPPVAFGTEIQVRDINSQVRVSGTVSLFKADQLHCRLWV